VPETVVLGITKQALAMEGVTVQVTLPVYPLFGVTVTVDVPEFPAETVTGVALSAKPLTALVTVRDTVPVEGA